MTIHIQVNKSEIAEARRALNAGEKFADRCFEILVQYWRADPAGIDKQALLEASVGHLIDCCTRGVEPMPYKEYVSDRLAAYSDIGLAKMGLTREQYVKECKWDNRLNWKSGSNHETT